MSSLVSSRMRGNVLAEEFRASAAEAKVFFSLVPIAQNQRGASGRRRP